MGLIYRRLKRSLAAVAGSGLLRPLFSPFLRGRVIVFMLHRFGEIEGTPVGPTPTSLRRMLEAIRHQGIPLLTLREVAEREAIDHGAEGVVFTVDDGYHDFDELAAPVFREMDCPVTVFIPTGFVDGMYWFWWDKIGFALDRTATRHLSLSHPINWDISLGSEAERIAAKTLLEEAVKKLPQGDREAVVQKVLEQLDVSIPERPPDEFKPLTWSCIRSLASRGVDFGPHSVHHPSFAALSSVAIRAEVRESYARLKQELADPVPIFCYPFGLSPDVSVEAARAVRAEGMIAAVTANPAYIGPDSLANPFLLPRFALSHDETEFRQILSGVDRFKDIVRVWARP